MHHELGVVHVDGDFGRIAEVRPSPAAGSAERHRWIRLLVRVWRPSGQGEFRARALPTGTLSDHDPAWGDSPIRVDRFGAGAKAQGEPCVAHRAVDRVPAASAATDRGPLR